MNKLDRQLGVKAIDAGTVFGASGSAGGASAWSAGGALRASLLRPARALLSFAADLRRSLRGRDDWRGSPLRRRREAAKYLVRALGMPLRHGGYLEFLYGNPRMRAYLQRDPRLLERHFHRYLHAQWSRRERLHAVQRHYQFALARLPGALFEAVYVDGGAELGRLSLKDGSELKLSLRPPIFLGSEGELCLQISDLADQPLYRIVFSVIGERPAIAIGSLQGPGGEHAKDVVRELTRNMHGLRPKQLMLSLVYAFARHYAVERVHAVGNAAHPLRRARRQFQADYDAFWQEQKGRDVGDGWFVLPEMPSHKCESEVPSRHRSAYRRREALRLEAEHLLVDALAAFPPRSLARWLEPAATGEPRPGLLLAASA